MVTEKVRYRLTLTGHMDGTPYLLLEPRDSDLSIIKDSPAWLGIELRAGTPFKQAEQGRKMLEETIEGLSYTLIPEPDDAT